MACCNITFTEKILLPRALQSGTCNPSYSRGRDQEIMVRSQARQIAPRDPMSKTPSQKMASEVAQSIGPEFKP
jgi:hypothetical protein